MIVTRGAECGRHVSGFRPERKSGDVGGPAGSTNDKKGVLVLCFHPLIFICARRSTTSTQQFQAFFVVAVCSSALLLFSVLMLRDIIMHIDRCTPWYVHAAYKSKSMPLAAQTADRKTAL